MDYRGSFPSRNSRYVALKILVSEMPSSINELSILRYIAQVAPAEGPRQITQLLGEFEHRGPNGIHKCLVLESMGPSVNTMVEELPQFKPRMWGMKIRYPPQVAKEHPQAVLAGPGISPREWYCPWRLPAGEHALHS